MKPRPPFLRPAAALALLFLTALLAACGRGTQKMPAPASMPVEAPAAANAPENAPRQVVPKTPFILPYGGEVSLQDGKVRLRFDQVLEDSRCPAKTFCVWTGQARLQLSAWSSGSPAEVFELSTLRKNMEPGDTYTYKDLRIELLSVDPYPENPREVIPTEDYQLTLLVTPLR